MKLETTARKLWSQLPGNGIAKPVFIIGCGRSGTTIFGKTLSAHREITYLNEPRHLWYDAYPQSDIWTDKARSRNGKLVFTAADFDKKKSRRLSRNFRFETLRSKKPVLVEKLPINNFRLELIHAMFPDARFIHIHRNGIEVAKSIEKICNNGGWFAANSYKWEKLVELALSQEETKHLPDLCSNFFDQGLLEWRLSTEAAVSFLESLPSTRFLEFSYNQLLDDTSKTISRVLEFIEVAGDPYVAAFIRENMARRSEKLSHYPLSKKQIAIGGKLLALSIDEAETLTAQGKLL
jgi:Sulfotransferase family